MLSSLGTLWLRAGLGRLETARWGRTGEYLIAALPGCSQVNGALCWSEQGKMVLGWGRWCADTTGPTLQGCLKNGCYYYI